MKLNRVIEDLNSHDSSKVIFARHTLTYVLVGAFAPPGPPSCPNTEVKLPHQSLGPIKNFEFEY